MLNLKLLKVMMMKLINMIKSSIRKSTVMGYSLVMMMKKLSVTS
jgi:hypothetical protein